MRVLGQPLQGWALVTAASSPGSCPSPAAWMCLQSQPTHPAGPGKGLQDAPVVSPSSGDTAGGCSISLAVPQGSEGLGALPMVGAVGGGAQESPAQPCPGQQGVPSLSGHLVKGAPDTWKGSLYHCCAPAARAREPLLLLQRCWLNLRWRGWSRKQSRMSQLSRELQEFQFNPQQVQPHCFKTVSSPLPRKSLALLPHTRLCSCSLPR